MKKATLLTLTLLSTSAFAVTPTDVCSSLSFSSSKRECIKLIHSGFISSGASKVCKNASFDSGKISCLKAALNKDFTTSELNFCNDNSFDSSRTECMEETGRSHQEVKPQQTIKKLKKKLKAKNEKIAELKAELESLKEELEFSSESKQEAEELATKALRQVKRDKVFKAQKTLRQLISLLQ